MTSTPENIDQAPDALSPAINAEFDAFHFANEWLSWNDARMLTALEQPIRCTSRNCDHRYAPIDGIEFTKYPVRGLDIEKTTACVRCPKCRGSSDPLLDDLNWRPRGLLCQGCGREAKLARFTQRKQIGLIIARLYSEDRRLLCAPCMSRVYRSMTGVTLVAGWWGIISFFVTPFVLISNTAAYLGRDRSASKPTGEWIDDRVPNRVREKLAPHEDWAIEELNAPDRVASSFAIANQVAERAGVSRIYAMIYLSQRVNERIHLMLEDAGPEEQASEEQAPEERA
ncbi:MAG: hypothetical protein ACIAQF_08920 [Phycisphaerales bacterium JB065]